MARNSPKSLTLRAYDVGFGDCLLLTFQYARRDRHVLIDFGTMRLPRGKAIKGYSLKTVAEAIRADTAGKLDVVVATHRHQDHISGFDPGDGSGPGAIIRSLKPELVIQPWTEDPTAATDAAAPARRGFARTLLEMHEVAGQVVTASRGLQGERFRAVRAQLEAIGMDNIRNAAAVRNLRNMAPNRYVHYGSNAGLGQILPGVRVTVLGPPTVEKAGTIRRQRSTDADEFWHLMNHFWRRLAVTGSTHALDSAPLFSGYPTGDLPRSAGWFRYTVMKEQSDALMAIVRMLDKAMNNTSIILLFEVDGRKILFPGDAQYENWMYALSKPAVRRKLEGVNLYKVGHHGSLNATPKSLWRAFRQAGPAGKPGRLMTVLSTLQGVHGSRERKTEVPRTSLLNALRTKSQLMNTEDLAADAISHSVTMEF